MTDRPPLQSTGTSISASQAQAHRRRRYAAELRLRVYGIAAITLAIGLLGILLLTLVLGGYQAFVQTYIRVDFPDHRRACRSRRSRQGQLARGRG